MDPVANDAVQTLGVVILLPLICFQALKLSGYCLLGTHFYIISYNYEPEVFYVMFSLDSPAAFVLVLLTHHFVRII